MNKFLSSVAISAMFITSAFAEGTFYQATSGQWSVTGYNGGPGQAADGSHFNTSCLAQTFWDDGSDLQLIQDLVDGELYIVFNNNSWNVEGLTTSIELGYRWAEQPAASNSSSGLSFGIGGTYYIW